MFSCISFSFGYLRLRLRWVLRYLFLSKLDVWSKCFSFELTDIEISRIIGATDKLLTRIAGGSSGSSGSSALGACSGCNSTHSVNLLI